MIQRSSYLVHQRSRLAWLGLASGLVMVTLAATRGAPLWAWIALTPCILICVLQIALRPAFGIGFSARTLMVFNGFSRQSLPIKGVDHLRLTDDGAAFVLRSGTEVALPRHMAHHTLSLIREVTDRGIPVRAI